MPGAACRNMHKLLLGASLPSHVAIADAVLLSSKQKERGVSTLFQSK
jgi:hypothetical protein